MHAQSHTYHLCAPAARPRLHPLSTTESKRARREAAAPPPRKPTLHRHGPEPRVRRTASTALTTPARLRLPRPAPRGGVRRLAPPHGPPGRRVRHRQPARARLLLWVWAGAAFRQNDSDARRAVRSLT